MATKKKAPAAAQKKAAPAKGATTKKALGSAEKKAAPAKAGPKKKNLAKVSASNKPSAVEQIAALQAQVNELKKEAVAELKEKLVEARKVVRKLEDQLATLKH